MLLIDWLFKPDETRDATAPQSQTQPNSSAAASYHTRTDPTETTSNATTASTDNAHMKGTPHPLSSSFSKRASRLSVQLGGDDDGSHADGAKTESNAAVASPSRLRRLQSWLWRTLDLPDSSRLARAISIVIILVTALSVSAIVFESIRWPSDCETYNEYVNVTLVSDSTGADTTRLTRNWAPVTLCRPIVEGRYPYYEIEFACVIVFTLEYVLRLFASPAGPGLLLFPFLPMSIVDLLSILPWWIIAGQQWAQVAGADQALRGLSVLRVLRFSRALRIFKLSRNFTGFVLLGETLKRSASALLMLFGLTSISLLVFSTLIFYAESGTWDSVRQQYVRSDGQPSPFESIPRSMWWCLVTMTTVGYGDMVPITPVGYAIAAATMLCGLIIISLPITIIGANFDEIYRAHQQQERRQRLDAAKRARDAGASPTPRKSMWTPLRKLVGKQPSLLERQRAELRRSKDEILTEVEAAINRSQERVSKELDRLLANEEDVLIDELTAILERTRTNVTLDAGASESGRLRALVSSSRLIDQVHSSGAGSRGSDSPGQHPQRTDAGSTTRSAAEQLMRRLPSRDRGLRPQLGRTPTGLTGGSSTDSFGNKPRRNTIEAQQYVDLSEFD